MLVNIPYVSCPLFAVSVVLFVDLLKLLALALVPLGCLAGASLHRRAISGPEQLTDLLCTVHPRRAAATWPSAITSPSCGKALSGRQETRCVLHIRLASVMEDSYGSAYSSSSFSRFRGHIWCRRRFLWHPVARHLFIAQKDIARCN